RGGRPRTQRMDMTQTRRTSAPSRWGLLLSLLTTGAMAQSVPLGPASALPSLAPLVETVGAAVVNVDVRAKAQVPQGMQGMPFGDLFGPQGPVPQQEQLRTGQGSGFIVDASG